MPSVFSTQELIYLFTVVCLVTWPLNETEAGVDPACYDKELPPFLMLMCCCLVN